MNKAVEIYRHTSVEFDYIKHILILYIVGCRGHKLTSRADEWAANINDDTAMVNFMVDVDCRNVGRLLIDSRYA